MVHGHLACSLTTTFDRFGREVSPNTIVVLLRKEREVQTSYLVYFTESGFWSMLRSKEMFFVERGAAQSVGVGRLRCTGGCFGLGGFCASNRFGMSFFYARFHFLFLQV